MKTPFRLLLALFVCAFSVLAVHAADDVEQVIARARATVGSEAALSSLQSLHYAGTLTTTAKDDKGERPIKVAIEIIFQRPYHQRIVATSENKIEITALDDYEGWQREQDPADPTRWRMTLLPPEQIKRLRANTWENLSFFRGLGDRRGGAVKDLGTVQLDGKACRKLAFDHGDNIVFTRYFDVAGGQLVLTETENGIKIREEGEIEAGGIKFPKKIISTNKSPDGAERVVTITFDKITVNETFADSLFAVPAMGR